ncbi:HlyD family secretion protein [Prevotella sp. 10(H)]|uniref:HlyD family secretion protein n=1 Tax=Prevotella sp. 10(H) TaxID=1158294 RepID=UPI0004A6E046|nr:HlyD family secretion protein [Prevotella sp. 10(H)]
MQLIDEIDNSIESYLYKKTSTSHKIYIVTTIAILVVFIALPFIYIDVSTQSTGVIRPKGERTEIKASVSEFIDSVYVREGQSVKEGDILLRLRSSNVGYQINYQGRRKEEYANHIADLEVLVTRRVPGHFKSSLYQQEYMSFRKKVTEAETSLEKAMIDHNRNQALHEKGVISTEEFEGYIHAQRQAENTLATIRETQYSEWQTALKNYKEQLIESEANLLQEEKNLDMYYIKSPINGTLDLFSGIYTGGSVRTGETLAIISPDADLYAEIQVSTRDIGYITVGMPITVQVESFNYNEWGVIDGTVTDISSDFFQDTENNTTYYKVRCSMEKNYLELKNGRKGYLKKGMSIRANFILNKRSLFELIYMKADEIFNPKQYQ